jgi:hypothetical protein
VWAATLAGEGVAALFKGMSSPLATAALQNAVCFHTYAAASRALSPAAPVTSDAGAAAAGRQPLLSYTRVFVAGCAAGAATTLLVTPVDLLKTQLQVRRTAHKRTNHVRSTQTRLLTCSFVAPRHAPRCAWGVQAAGRWRSRRPSCVEKGHLVFTAVLQSPSCATHPLPAFTTSCMRRARRAACAAELRAAVCRCL